MQKIIKKSTAIRWVVAIIALGLIISIFPLHFWPQIQISEVPRTSNEASGPATTDIVVEQSFIAEYEHLYKLRLFLTSGTKGSSFIFRMTTTDPGRRLMFEDIIAFDTEELPGYIDILIDQILEVDETYHYGIWANDEDTEDAAEVIEARIFLGSEWTLRADYPYMGHLYHGRYPMSGQSLVARYEYHIPLEGGPMWTFIALILLLAGLALLLIHAYYKKHPERDELIIAEDVLKKILNPLIFILVILGFFAVACSVFGSYLLDNIVFAIGVLLFGGICYYAVNHDRSGQKPILTSKILRENWLDYLQSILFALCFHACCEYMCATQGIQQSIAQSKQLIFFGLVMLTMMQRKRVFNVINLIYLTIAIGLAYYWHTEQVLYGLGELTAAELTDIGLSAVLYVLGGLIILNVCIGTVSALIKKEMKAPCISFAALVALFFSLWIVFSNGRSWPIWTVVAFVLFYLQYGLEKRGRVLQNICCGLILSFLWMVAFSLLYRPFATHTTVRYPMFFHTVTITATYLSLVCAVSLFMLLMKMKKSLALKNLWKECLLLGIALTYMLLTISWTGYLTFFVVAIFSLLVFSKKALYGALLMLMSVIICFPPIFFLQRNMPILVGKPYIYSDYDIEVFHQDVTRGRHFDSYEHMRLGRFIGVFAEKILGIPERELDIYGHTKIYEESHVVVAGEIMTTEEAESLGLEAAATIEEKRQEVEREIEQGSMSEDQLSSWESILDLESDDGTEDFSNGRMDLYKLYLAELNMDGHDHMGVELPDGTMSVHAHNIYIQFAYDHGIMMGILFIIVGGYAFIRAMIYYKKNDENESFAGAPSVIILAVATMGMVEWVFHLSNPSGFLLLLMLAPLLYREQIE